MITKEITLCGKPVTLAYCFATEISYKILSDEDIHTFLQEAVNAINEKRMPDIRRSIYLLLAAMNAYYESNGKKTPITDKQLMYEVSPEEMGTAIGTIIGLWLEFNHIPSDEPEDKPATDEEKEKNA
jgi:hypothetical protein